MLNANHLLQSRYRIIRLLGQGGMGTVYLAADTRLGDVPVAVKQMNPNQLQPQDRQWAVTAFGQEAALLARLRHPGIAAVTDYFSETGFSYLVMEYVEGEPLNTFLQRSGAISQAQALTWIKEIGTVLSYLHQQNPPIIFRDLKPGNVMIRPDNTLALIDFGIARLFKPGQSQDTVTIGTPGYAPPEQYGRGQTDPRSDVYSLGVVLHQLLTGYDPALSPMNLPPVRELNSTVSPHIATAIEQALHVNPTMRFTTVKQFLEALKGTDEFYPPTQPFAEKGSGSGRGMLMALLGGVVGLILCGAIVAVGWYFTAGPGSATPVPTSIVALDTATPTVTTTAEPPPATTVAPTATATTLATLTATPTVPPDEPTRTRAEIEAEYVAGLVATRPGNILFADRTNQPILIDGDISDWNTPRYPVEATVFGTGNWTGTGDLSAELQLAWDDDFLYLATQVRDDIFAKNAFERFLYQSDSLEIWFDSNLASDLSDSNMTADDYQIGISPGDFASVAPLAYLWQPVAQEGIMSAIQVASQPTALGYTVEVAMPWSLLGAGPHDGISYGFTLCVSDNDQPTVQSQDSMVCAHASRQLSDPTSLGTLVLITIP